MSTTLLERTEQIDRLVAVLRSASEGRGAVVFVAGEAGIGKTSLVREFVKGLDGRTRTLAGACDDLVTPRTLGAIRDAFTGCSPRLDAVLAEGTRDDVLVEVRSELTGSPRPTLLVVEDIHWADDATLDALRYVARRLEGSSTMVIITYRDDEIGRDHPAQRLLGGLGGADVLRLPVPRLTRSAVATLSGGTVATSAALYRLTDGNPFYVTEVVAEGSARSGDVTEAAGVPVTVVDAVLARVRTLAPEVRSALEQLAVVPGHVELSLAQQLLGDLGVLAEAERRGMLEIRSGAVAFRHELARRAVEDSMTVSERMRAHGRVLSALTARDELDLPRILHHAVEAGDHETVVELAPRAAARAAQAGSYTQEIRYYRLLLEREHLMAPSDLAAAHSQLARALWVVDQLPEALEHGLSAVRLREELDDVVALGETLVALPPTQISLSLTGDALASCTRAVELLGSVPETPQRTSALVHHSLLLSIIGRWDALAVAEEAIASARRTGIPELLAMATLSLGRATTLTGSPDEGLELIEEGLAAARAIAAHWVIFLTYGFTVIDLFDLGRFEECRRFVDEATLYANENEMWFLVEHLEAYGHFLAALRGEWSEACAGLRRIVGLRQVPDKPAARYALGPLARLLARQGDESAPEFLERARDFARASDCYHEWMLAGLAEIETAWLTELPSAADDAIARLEEMTDRPGRETERGELQRWKRRLGLPYEVPAGCPDRFAAGIRGDWQAAAAAWGAVGAPYEQALELLDSGAVDPTLRALSVLDGLGAGPPARVARRRLRELGLSQIPSGPTASTRANPAGLTARQVDVLRLLAEGLTNAEIATRLVISEKTADHHVSAILGKLGVPTRREAAAAARTLGIARERRRTPRDRSS